MTLHHKDITPGNVYRNKKNGKLYYIMAISISSEDGEMFLVTYISQDGLIWTRPFASFMIKFETIEQVFAKREEFLRHVRWLQDSDEDA